MSYLIHIADIHFGTSLFGPTYYDAQCYFFQQLHEYINQSSDNCEGIIISGDLFKRSSPNKEHIMQAFTHLSDLVNTSIPVFLIDGNHDIPHNNQDLYINTLFKHIGIHYCQDKNSITRTIYDEGDKIINPVLINYIPQYAESDILNNLITYTRDTNYNIFMMHGCYESVKLSNTYTLKNSSSQYTQRFFKDLLKSRIGRYEAITTNEIMPVMQPLLFLMGDIHYPQTIEIEEDGLKAIIIYPGSPVPVDYGEDHDHGFYVHNFDRLGLYQSSAFQIVKSLKVNTKIISIDKNHENIKIHIIDAIEDAINSFDITEYKYGALKIKIDIPIMYSNYVNNIISSYTGNELLKIIHVEYINTDQKSVICSEDNTSTIFTYYGTEDRSLDDLSMWLMNQDIVDKEPYINVMNEVRNASL